jgi:anti-anti-sigma factor
MFSRAGGGNVALTSAAADLRLPRRDPHVSHMTASYPPSMVSGAYLFDDGALGGSILLEREEDQTVLRLVGEIDMDVVERLASINNWRPPVVDAIDAGGVTYLSSMGVGYMVRVLERSRAQGRAALVRSASPMAKRVLSRSGLAEMFGLME